MASNETSKYKLSVVEGTELQMSLNTGVQGPAGPAGPAGPQGETGPQGEVGPAGIDALWNFRGAFLDYATPIESSRVLRTTNILIANDGYTQFRFPDMPYDGLFNGKSKYVSSDGTSLCQFNAQDNTWELSKSPDIYWYSYEYDPSSLEPPQYSWTSTGSVDGFPNPEIVYLQYTSTESFAIGDIVTYNGSLWYCYTAYTENGSPKYPQSGSSFWQPIASKGADGLDGPVGPAGVDGESGINIRRNWGSVYDLQLNYEASYYLSEFTTNLNNIPQYRDESNNIFITSNDLGNVWYFTTFDGVQWSGSGSSPELVTNWTPSGSASYTPFIMVQPPTFEVGDIVQSSGSFWYCYNSYTEGTNWVESGENLPYQGSPYWKFIGSTRPAFGDGLAFNPTTDTVSCGTNIARRSGAQVFSGNNTFTAQVELSQNQSLSTNHSVITRSLGDARYGVTYVGIKEENVTSTNNTPIKLTSVTLPIGMYQIDCCIAATAATGNGGYLYGLRASSNIRLSLYEQYGADNTTVTNSVAASDSTQLSQREITTTTNLSHKRQLMGLLEVLTDDTEVSIEFCQAVTTPSVPNTTRKRSYIIAKRIA